MSGDCEGTNSFQKPPTPSGRSEERFAERCVRGSCCIWRIPCRLTSGGILTQIWRRALTVHAEREDRVAVAHLGATPASQRSSVRRTAKMNGARRGRPSGGDHRSFLGVVFNPRSRLEINASPSMPASIGVGVIQISSSPHR